MRVSVLVWLKPGFKDSAAEDHKDKMVERGIAVESIRSGKRFDLEVNTEDTVEAKRIASEAATKLLANPVNEEFEVAFLEPLRGVPQRSAHLGVKGSKK